jgi:hypothetical protein
MHTNIHGSSHTLNDCPGGSLSDAVTALRTYAGALTCLGSSSRRTNSQIISSIDSYSPLYTRWGYYVGTTRTSGHAMVLCGYDLSDSTSVLTLTIRDSNYSSYKYISTTISSTSDLYYLINGNNYRWDGTVYNI